MSHVACTAGSNVFMKKIDTPSDFNSFGSFTLLSITHFDKWFVCWEGAWYADNTLLLLFLKDFALTLSMIWFVQQA